MLAFTEIDCSSGLQKHYFASIDTNGFFLREYIIDEDPSAPISTNNRPLRSNFYGENARSFWNIDAALEINKADRLDKTPNVCQLGARTSAGLIRTVLNLGLSGLLAERGSFVWSGTNFTFRPLAGVTIRNAKTGLLITNPPGRIVVENGLVVKMIAHGETINYQYSTNSSVPSGLPTEVILGKSPTECRKIFLIEELAYRQPSDPVPDFDPQARFSSTNVATVFLITNGIRNPLDGPSGRIAALVPGARLNQKQGDAIVARVFFFSAAILTPFLIYFLLKRSGASK